MFVFNGTVALYVLSNIGTDKETDSRKKKKKTDLGSCIWVLIKLV